MSADAPLRVTLEEYSSTVEEAYRTLLPAHDDRVAAGQLRWKLNDSPAGCGMAAVARVEGRIVGLNAFMAVRMLVRGRELVGHQSMDTIVLPEARGRGIFGSLVDCFYREAASDFLYGFPNSQSAHAFFGRLGWTRFGQVPMMVKPLRMGFLTRQIFKSRTVVDVGESELLDVIELPGSIPPRIGEAWDEFSSGVEAAIPRTYEYLRWRLIDHPTISYEMFSGEDGAFSAASVQNKHGARVGYLMEAIGNRSGLREVINASTARMRDRGAEVAFAWSLPGTPAYRSLLRAGYVPFPRKLRPIEINFGARFLADTRALVPLRRRDWYISYLDSDTV